MQWTKATWVKGKKRIKGRWYYNWADDCFWIILDDADPITGQERKIRVRGEHPEFNGWELVARCEIGEKPRAKR